MLTVARGITTLNEILFSVAKWLIFAIATLMLIEIISRALSLSETSWAGEFATLLFGPFFLLGGPYLLHLGGHVAVDILSSKLTGKPARGLKAIGIILALVFGGILLWFSLPLAIQSFEYAETSYSGWNPVIWPTKMALPFAGLLLMLQAIAELIFLTQAKDGETK